MKLNSLAFITSIYSAIPLINSIPIGNVADQMFQEVGKQFGRVSQNGPTLPPGQVDNMITQGKYSLEQIIAFTKSKKEELAISYDKWLAQNNDELRGIKDGLEDSDRDSYTRWFDTLSPKEQNNLESLHLPSKFDENSDAINHNHKYQKIGHDSRVSTQDNRAFHPHGEIQSELSSLDPAYRFNGDYKSNRRVLSEINSAQQGNRINGEGSVKKAVTKSKPFKASNNDRAFLPHGEVQSDTAEAVYRFDTGYQGHY